MLAPRKCWRLPNRAETCSEMTQTPGTTIAWLDDRMEEQAVRLLSKRAARCTRRIDRFNCGSLVSTFVLLAEQSMKTRLAHHHLKNMLVLTLILWRGRAA